MPPVVALHPISGSQSPSPYPTPQLSGLPLGSAGPRAGRRAEQQGGLWEQREQKALGIAGKLATGQLGTWGGGAEGRGTPRPHFLQCGPAGEPEPEEGSEFPGKPWGNLTAWHRGGSPGPAPGGCGWRAPSLLGLDRGSGFIRGQRPRWSSSVPSCPLPLCHLGPTERWSTVGLRAEPSCCPLPRSRVRPPVLMGLLFCPPPPQDLVPRASALCSVSCLSPRDRGLVLQVALNTHVPTASLTQGRHSRPCQIGGRVQPFPGHQGWTEASR